MAVAPVVVDGLFSGEKKNQSVNIFQEVPRSAQMMIVPDINILNPEVFKGFSTGPGEAK